MKTSDFYCRSGKVLLRQESPLKGYNAIASGQTGSFIWIAVVFQKSHELISGCR